MLRMDYSYAVEKPMVVVDFSLKHSHRHRRVLVPPAVGRDPQKQPSAFKDGAHQSASILKDLDLLHKEIKKNQRLASAESV